LVGTGSFLFHSTLKCKYYLDQARRAHSQQH
jgi:hypothetical protein